MRRHSACAGWLVAAARQRLTLPSIAGMAGFMNADLELRAVVPWLIRLRWIACGGTLLLVCGAAAWIDQSLPSPWLSMVLLSLAGSNLAFMAYERRALAMRHAHAVGAVLVLDVLLLTVSLAAAGGPMNPFSVFYLVLITLAAVVLGARSTALVATLSVACFAALFAVPNADAHAGHGLHHHLRGMWLAFTLAAALVAYFVGRIAATFAKQREQLAQLREDAAKHARMAALTTLAAGAAHELGTPLGTIAVAAHEMELALAKVPGAEDSLSDARLILLEVERCQEILSQMAARSSCDPETTVDLSSEELRARLLNRFDGAVSDRVRIRPRAPDIAVATAVEPLLQSLAALVKNGLDASPEGGAVEVAVTGDPECVRIAVSDSGAGIPEELLSRVGEPFFTTKEPGRGLGLGLFLARAYAESQGGSLELCSTPGKGTVATLALPRVRSAAG